MRFLVDAQLPPALVAWLRRRGHEADHVRDLGLDRRPDSEIAAKAAARSAVIVTKDADFAHLSSTKPGCRVVWLRFGNATSWGILQSLEPVFGEVEQALADGQVLVEVSR